MLMTLMMV